MVDGTKQGNVGFFFFALQWHAHNFCSAVILSTPESKTVLIVLFSSIYNTKN
jgi:hypothetical protein